MSETSYFDLMRSFWDFSYENPDMVTPNHCAVFAFAVEHCNRLGWKEKFGLPTTMVMEAVGIKSYNTYAKVFKDLVKWNGFKLIQQSKNQYSSNVIALSKFNKAHNKALDKALIKHTSKQSESTVQSNDSIIRQETIDNKQETIDNLIKPKKSKVEIPNLNDFLNYVRSIPEFAPKFESLKFSITAKYESWIENGWKDGNDTPIKNWKTKIKNTLPHLKPLNNNQNGTKERITADEQIKRAVDRVMYGDQQLPSSEIPPSDEEADFTYVTGF